MVRLRPAVWKSWSSSKLVTLYRCPLNFQLEFVERMVVPVSVAKVFGIALHYMMARFLKVNFQSLKTFLGTWQRFWFEITAGEHGPQSYNCNQSPPVELVFLNPPKNKRQYLERCEEFYRRGYRILERFGEENWRYREFLRPIPEKRVSFEFQGFKIRGQADRWQPLKDGGWECWDYKSNFFDRAALSSDLQFTIYQLDHLLEFGENPAGLFIYNYYQGINERQNVPLRNRKDFKRLAVLLTEAFHYVKGVLLRQLPHEAELEAFQIFKREDVEKGMFSPKLPRGIHCRLCDYPWECLKWEAGHFEIASTRLARKELTRQKSKSNQLVLEPLLQ